MPYEDSHPGSGYGASSGNPNGGVGGNGNRGGSGGGNGGGRVSGYTFRSYPGNPNIQGNWNTGGAITGRGSFAQGIMSALNQGQATAQSQPLGRTPSVITPAALPPAAPPVTYPPVSGPPTRTDLNPATLAPWTGVGLNNYNSTFPARPGVSPRIGVSGKDQSRISQGLMNSGFGNDQFGRSFGDRQGWGGGSSGGGFGGGGGGGW